MSFRSRKQLEMERKVVAFIIEHPLSTASEVFNATGSGVVGHRFLRPTKYNGQTVWRLNHPKWKSFCANQV